jgi:hypothetical protein
VLPPLLRALGESETPRGDRLLSAWAAAEGGFGGELRATHKTLDKLVTAYVARHAGSWGVGLAADGTCSAREWLLGAADGLLASVGTAELAVVRLRRDLCLARSLE